MGVQILSHELIGNLSSSKKIRKILEIVKKGDVVLIEGRLKSEEELSLTSQALENVSGKFTGIEIAFLDSVKSKSPIDTIKQGIIKILAKERLGITVIGPSKIIKEIKMNPNKLEILFK